MIDDTNETSRVVGDPADVALLTDQYELTMLQAYRAEGMREPAVFSLFARRLPKHRNYLLACGLDTVLDYIENFHFSDEAREYLASTGLFSSEFVDSLADLRFTGDVWAIPEGTPVFPDEPLLEVEAPIAEAQILETFVMNQVHMQTGLASKAARVKAAGGKRTVVDFGLRRMHGADAGLPTTTRSTRSGPSCASFRRPFCSWTRMTPCRACGR